MMISFFALQILVSAQVGLPAQVGDLLVVGVYRPLELDGRRIHTERVVYLRSGDGEGESWSPPDKGSVLGVYRSSTVGTSMASEASQNPFLGVDAMNEEAAKPLGRISIPLAGVKRGSEVELPPSEELSDTETGRPAGFVSITEVEGSARETRKSAELPMAGASMVRVGTIRIDSIVGKMIVGRVLVDGLRHGTSKARAQEPGTEPVVMAGDIARIESKAKKVERKAPKMSALLKRELKKERDELVRALKRKRRKPKPFRRNVMKWDL
jgi:hypothetical protein